MTPDASRHPTRPSASAAAWTMLATLVALSTIAIVVVACTPPRDTAPTPRPTIAVVGPSSAPSRRT